jgi:drug/metabolite transporter (DMT)-like permease
MRAVHRTAVRAHAGRLAIMAVLVTSGVSAFTLAIRDMSPAIVALINYAYPVYVIVGARLLGWIRLDLLTTLAAAAALGGVGLTIGVPGGEIGVAGVLLSIFSGAAYAIYLLMAEHTMRRVGPLSAMSMVGGLTSVFLLAGAAFSHPEFPSADAKGIAVTLILFACLCFPHALLLRGVGQIGGTWGSLISSLEVVTAVVTTAIIVGVPFSPGVVVGGVLILLGGLAAPIVAARRGTIQTQRAAFDEVQRPVAEKCW